MIHLLIFFSIQHNVGTAAEIHNGMLTAWAQAQGKYNLIMSEAIGHFDAFNRASTRQKAGQLQWVVVM